MGYREDMKRCRDYIATHPEEEVTPQKLADIFGYSFYHFCHIFRSVNGVTVGEFLRDRRLCCAASELLQGRSVTETAMDSGFDTVSGFTRAFRRRFGMTPSGYKKKKGGNFNMKPEIKKLDQMVAIGYTQKPEAEIDIREHGAFWKSEDYAPGKKEQPPSNHQGRVGLWLHPSEKSGDFYYFFGSIVGAADSIPPGMEELRIPAATYAVFPVPKDGGAEDLQENVRKTWRAIYNDWFDGSEYQSDHGKMSFEHYIGDDAFVCVPILKKDVR